MELTLWTYEGPPHVGAMRVATAMKGVHYVLHAPQGDTYADLLFTMIERRDHRPPVTYTTFQARDLGGDTAGMVKTFIREAWERYRPQAMLVGESCTAELIQDDPGGLAATLDLPIPVIPLDLPAYQRKENWGASETFYQLVRALAGPHAPPPGAPRPEREPGAAPSCNLLGPTALGFRHRDDVTEIRRLLEAVGVEVRVVAPLDATPGDLARLGEADFNVVLYPEIGATAASWLKRTFRQPVVDIVPMGVGATRDFLRQVAEVAGLAPERVASVMESRLPWYSRSVDSTYLTGKRVFIFGDATHAVAAARVAREEMGFEVVGIGAYNREFAREVRACARELGLEPLITDDYLEVERAIVEAAPEMVLGTQMERHIAKRLGLFCAVISAPVHVQDFPARYSPLMGPEGANVLFDTWVHPLMMGLEEHLLGMFQEDFEFGNGAAPSHLRSEHPTLERLDGVTEATARPGSISPPEATPAAERVSDRDGAPPPEGVFLSGPAATPEPALPLPTWTAEAERELGRIPFFVRKKARRNTERYAMDLGLREIGVETLYEAKVHYGGR
jgi:light-independent protochlorophyllide reductase subunit B